MNTRQKQGYLEAIEELEQAMDGHVAEANVIRRALTWATELMERDIRGVDERGRD